MAPKKKAAVPRAVARQLKDGAIVMDKDGKLLYRGPSAEQQTPIAARKASDKWVPCVRVKASDE